MPAAGGIGGDFAQKYEITDFHRVGPATTPFVMAGLDPTIHVLRLFDLSESPGLVPLARGFR
jgi:hypothetical protein